MTETAFVESLRARARELLGREIDLAAFADTLWEGLFPNEPMIAFMASLRDEGYRMALLTNNVREWELRWRALAPVDDIFELVIDSAFVGVRKPDPEIYALTVTGLGVPAAECLFIDDIEVNCVAAREAGMSAVVFRDTEQAIAEMRGRSGPQHPMGASKDLRRPQDSCQLTHCYMAPSAVHPRDQWSVGHPNVLPSSPRAAVRVRTLCRPPADRQSNRLPMCVGPSTRRSATRWVTMRPAIRCLDGWSEHRGGPLGPLASRGCPTCLRRVTKPSCAPTHKKGVAPPPDFGPALS